LYPRWAPDLAMGYGYPIFNYYAPLFYYVAEIPRLFGASFDLAFKLAIFGTFGLYGLATYWWIKPILGSAAATVSGIAYLYVPFRFHEAYMQGDYPQFLALGLAPLALGAVHRLILADRFSYGRFLFAVGCVSSIVVVHNISTLWIIPMLAAYSLALIVGRALGHGEKVAGSASSRRLLAVAVAGLLALGLTAFFWLPALAEQNLVQLYRLRTADFDVRNAFLTVSTLLAPPTVVDQTAANPPPFFHLGWGQLLVAALTVPLSVLSLKLRGLSTLRREWNVMTHLGFGWCLLLASAAMTLPVSTPVWLHLPFLAYTEYPWRLLQLSGMATALLAGLTVHLGLRVLRRAGSSDLVRTSLVGLTLLVLVGPSLVYLYPRAPFLTFGELTAADVTGFETSGGALGTTSAGEYFPVDVAKVPTSPRPADSAGGRLARSSLAAGDQVTFLGSAGYTERYTSSLTRPTLVRFNLLNFPGWQVTVDGQAVETSSTVPDGLLLASIPSGSHQVVLSFGDTPIRRAGWLLAAFTVVLLVIGGLLQFRGSKPAREVPAAGSRSSVQNDPPEALSLTTRGVAILGAGFLVIAVLRITSPTPYASVFARQSPLDRVIGTSHPLQVNLADNVELLGYDLDTTTVKPGGNVTVTLYWRPLRPLQKDYRSLGMIARVGDQGLLNQDDRPNPGKTPTHAWRADQYVIDQHTISVPAQAPPMVYQVQVALYDPKTLAHLQQSGITGWQGEQVILAQIHVERPAPVDPSTYHSVGDPVFGGTIGLRGYTLSSAQVHPGDKLDFSLTWRAERPIATDYTIFAHLIDAKQNQVAGSDSMPRDGNFPTSTWLVGEDVVDPHPLTVPANLAPGAYHLAFGVYDAKTGQRLEATAQGWAGPRSQIDLDEVPITVEPSQ
jgi:hypothetical protein